MLGAELTQMPAWYVDLSYARALESYALLARLPANSTLQLFQQGVRITSRCRLPGVQIYAVEVDPTLPVQLPVASSCTCFQALCHACAYVVAAMACKL